MAKAKRIERVIALTKLLTDNPHYLFSFTYFCDKFEIAKSTLSEDVAAVKAGLELYGLGHIETIAGSAGGVRYIPGHTEASDKAFLQKTVEQLSSSDRILIGNMLYITDLLSTPSIVRRLGEIIMHRLQHLQPDCIVTVETSGLPLAMAVAQCFNKPLIIARHGSSITEGYCVSINYVSSSSNLIQNMVMPRRAMQEGSRALLVDDVLRGGGTTKALEALCREVGMEPVGKAFFIAYANPEKKRIEAYTSLLTLNNVNEEELSVDIELT